MKYKEEILYLEGVEGTGTGTGTGCPEKVWMSHPQRCSRPSWIGPCGTWCGGRCPCSLQGLGTRRPLRSLPTPAMLWLLVSLLFSASSTTRNVPQFHPWNLKTEHLIQKLQLETLLLHYTKLLYCPWRCQSKIPCKKLSWAQRLLF